MSSDKVIEVTSMTQESHERPVQGLSPWNLRCRKRQLDKIKEQKGCTQRQ